jgi:hypothetical protein
MVNGPTQWEDHKVGKKHKNQNVRNCSPKLWLLVSCLLNALLFFAQKHNKSSGWDQCSLLSGRPFGRSTCYLYVSPIYCHKICCVHPHIYIYIYIRRKAFVVFLSIWAWNHWKAFVFFNIRACNHWKAWSVLNIWAWDHWKALWF